MDKIDIIIPVWNQLDVTKECVDSILKNTDHPYRLVVIDNGSEADTEAYLKSLKKVEGLDLLLIRNDKNLGFVKAVNQGIVSSDAEYLCIQNNDTIVTKGWLGEMVRVMDRYPEIGLLNPSSNTSGQFPAEGQTIDDHAMTFSRFRGQIQELYTCRGFSMLIRREVIKKIGMLDEIYHMGYFDDTDYCKRAQVAGYRTARAKAAYVYHKENTSFKALKDNKKLFQDNERVFFGRWGRQVRVGYFIDRLDQGSRIGEVAIDVARNGHQILLFLKKGLDWPVSLDHFDIRRIDVNPMLYNFFSIYKILSRKKKKKLDIIVTDNRSFGSLLNMTKALHGSEVLVNPDRELILSTIKKKSQEY